MPKENETADRTRRRRNKRTPVPDSPYLRSVLELYCRLPHTPRRPRPDDRFVVRQLESQAQPLLRVRAALLLGTARRLFRVEDSDPLMPIRSIRFFLPVIDELQLTGFDPAYVRYLTRKISDATGSELALLDDSDPTEADRPRHPRQLDLPW